MRISDISIFLLIIALCCLGCGQVETDTTTLLPTTDASEQDSNPSRGEVAAIDARVFEVTITETLPETVSKPPPSLCTVPVADKPFIQKECKQGCAMCQIEVNSDPTSHPQLNHCQFGDAWCVPSCEECP